MCTGNAHMRPHAHIRTAMGQVRDVPLGTRCSARRPQLRPDELGHLHHCARDLLHECAPPLTCVCDPFNTSKKTRARANSPVCAHAAPYPPLPRSLLPAGAVAFDRASYRTALMARHPTLLPPPPPPPSPPRAAVVAWTGRGLAASRAVVLDRPPPPVATPRSCALCWMPGAQPRPSLPPPPSLRLRTRARAVLSRSSRTQAACCPHVNCARQIYF